MIVKEAMQQGSDEWHAVRRGRPTASQFSRVCTAKTGALSAGRFDYIDELIAECFFPDYVAFEGNYWTDRGNELEPQARDEFRELSKFDVVEVGFCTQDAELLGCSPDGLLRSNGEFYSGLELKCPAPKKHVTYMREGVLPDAYKQQVHGSMIVTGLDSWHFVSFCPGVKLFWLTVVRDDYTEKLEDALELFVGEYVDTRAKLVPMLQRPELDVALVE